MEPTELAGAWAAAQRLWGVRLPPPLIEPGPGGMFAWFTFPARVHVDLALLTELGLAAHLDTVFAHEIGHHVLIPATPLAHRRIRDGAGRALLVAGAPDDPRLPAVADRLANLWSDLLINTRVEAAQRAAGFEPGMVAMWRALSARWPAADTAWWLVLRAYELLFRLPAGALCTPAPPAPPPPAPPPPAPAGLDPVADARRLADLVAGSGPDPAGAAPSFGLLYAPYLVITGPDDGPGRWRGERVGAPGAGCGGLGDAWCGPHANTRPGLWRERVFG